MLALLNNSWTKIHRQQSIEPQFKNSYIKFNRQLELLLSKIFSEFYQEKKNWLI